MFRKVHATKPKASRSESAEIFVVCEDYLAPDIIDPKFFQSNYLFKDVKDAEEIKKAKKEFLKPVQNQKKVKATGYEDNLGLLDFKLKASDFLKSKNHVELLSKSNQIVFDDQAYLDDPLTTEQIKEYCDDIKVLSRKEILELLKWQRSMRKKHVKEEVEENKNAIEEIDENEIETEESQIDKLLKKKKKKVLKEKRKLIERMNLKMVHKDDMLVDDEDEGLFSLSKLNKDALSKFENAEDLEDEEDEELEFEDDEDDAKLSKMEKKALQKLKDNNITYVDKSERLNLDEFDTQAIDSDVDDLDEFEHKIDENKRKKLSKLKALSDKIDTIEYKMKARKLKGMPSFDNEDEDDEEFNLSDDEDQNDLEDDDVTADESEDFEKNNLLVDLDDKQLSKTNMFFKTGLFNEANFDDDLEFDLIPEDNKKSKKSKELPSKDTKPQKKRKDEQIATESSSDSEAEELAQPEKKAKQIKLDATGLALGTLMKRSNKTKRDIENEGWNRYDFS